MSHLATVLPNVPVAGDPPTESHSMPFSVSSISAARRAALLALLLPSALVAQSGTGAVSGRVAAAGEGVPGVSVLATGTGRGTLTRGDGTYRLTLPAGRYEIRARLIGFTSGRDSVTITDGGSATANFA